MVRAVDLVVRATSVPGVGAADQAVDLEAEAEVPADSAETWEDLPAEGAVKMDRTMVLAVRLVMFRAAARTNPAEVTTKTHDPDSPDRNCRVQADRAGADKADLADREEEDRAVLAVPEDRAVSEGNEGVEGRRCSPTLSQRAKSSQLRRS